MCEFTHVVVEAKQNNKSLLFYDTFTVLLL